MMTGEDTAFHLVAAHGKTDAIAGGEVFNARLHARLHLMTKAQHSITDLGWDENLLEWALEHAESAPEPVPEPPPFAPNPALVTPKTDSRERAMQVWRAVFALIVAAVLVLGGTMTALHGYAFFVFRSAGFGQTSNNGLQENQGPGQPDAPRVVVHHGR